MTKEDKELLIKEISSRLPYGIKAPVLGWDEEKGEVEVPLKVYSINTDGYVYFETNEYDVNYISVEECRLYLRPMSSMTEKELYEVQGILGKGVEIREDFLLSVDSSIDSFTYLELQSVFDWLNKNHFDYCGLIPRGLAIEVTKENNPYK